METCLQEKYYPTRNFLAFSFGCRPSFLWRSLFEGRNLLFLGLRHHISNGLSTSIFEDIWIPTLKSSLLHLSTSQGIQNEISDLIDYNQCFWMKDKVRSLFLHHEPEAILNIPFNIAWLEDNLIQNFTQNGIYTVKSRYKIGMEFMQNLTSAQETSSIEAQTKPWTMIHDLSMQPKIRMFLWRITSDILLTRRNLMS